MEKNKASKKSNLTKFQQKSIRNLTEDVHKSRIAVQHITKNSQEEHKLANTFQAIKTQINQCVLQINTQQRKQNVLKELVALLKGEMSQIEIKDAEDKRRDEQELDKKLKQMRDDIDRIFLKKNHEVAKIAQLKQCANQRRSERVVYSSLFKKIEKELKQSEQIYKNEILRSEKSKIDLEMPAAEKSKLKAGHDVKASSLFSSNFNEFEQFSPRFLNSSDSSKHENKDFQQQTCKELYKNQYLLKLKTVLSQDQPGVEASMDPSFYSQSQAQVNSVRPSTRVNKIGSTKQNIMNFQIATEELQKLTQRIKLACGVSSVQQINAMMNSLPRQNEKLQQEITQINGEIEIRLKKNFEVCKHQERKQAQDLEFNQFQEDLSLSSSLFGTKQFRFENKKKYKKKLRFSSQQSYHSQNIPHHSYCKQKGIIFKQFAELCCLLKPSEHQKDKLSQLSQNSQIRHINSSQLQDMCKQMDNTICCLFPRNEQSENELLRCSGLLKTSENEERENRNYDEKAGQLNQIINKMTKYGHCEKFLDRNEFYQEYHKELTKKTKFRSKRL